MLHMSWRYSSWTDNGLFGIQRQSLTLAVYLFNTALNDIWRGQIHFLDIVTRLHKNTSSPYTIAGYIDPIMVVQWGGRSSGRGGWTTGLQLQGIITLCGFRMVADLYVEFGPLEIQYATP